MTTTGGVRTCQIVAHLRAANGTKTIREMAGELGISYDRTRNYCASYKIPYKLIQPPAYVPSERDDRIIRAMRESKTTISAIAEALGISQHAVFGRLRAMGMTRRGGKSNQIESLNTPPIRCNDEKFRRLMGDKRFEDVKLKSSTPTTIALPPALEAGSNMNYGG